jgi:hypothetical protein
VYSVKSLFCAYRIHQIVHGAAITDVQKNKCPKVLADSSYGGDKRHTYDCDLEKLYNLKDDPQEKHNIIDQHPEIANQIKARINHYLKHRPPQQNLRLQWNMKEVVYLRRHVRYGSH